MGAARGGRAAPAERHELWKAPSNEIVADRANEIDLQASDHAAPGDRRRAHEVRLTAALRSPVENFRCLAAEGYQLLLEGVGGQIVEGTREERRRVVLGTATHP